uniref:Uncharacterized protein n=1 Tax=Knipowitschia caucasica TaxID=637954 RepID=A0AAV2J6N9_KNICA
MQYHAVSAGREWYIHTIYTVRSRESANRGIGKRSLEYHAFSSHAGPSHFQTPPLSNRTARSTPRHHTPDLAAQIGEANNRGTNILHIALERSSPVHSTVDRARWAEAAVPREVNRKSGEGGGGEDGLVLMVGGLVGLLLTLLIIILVLLLVRSKQRRAQEKPKKSGSAEPMVAPSGSDSSEV